MPFLLFCIMSLKIILIKLLSYLPGAIPSNNSEIEDKHSYLIIGTAGSSFQVTFAMAVWPHCHDTQYPPQSWIQLSTLFKACVNSECLYWRFLIGGVWSLTPLLTILGWIRVLNCKKVLFRRQRWRHLLNNCFKSKWKVYSSQQIYLILPHSHWLSGILKIQRSFRYPPLPPKHTIARPWGRITGCILGVWSMTALVQTVTKISS